MSVGGSQAPLVVKLGGSLSKSDELHAWLEVIREAAGSVVLVPGGGPFADQVRLAQARWHFDDATAHHLAVLAMEQYGRMLVGLEPTFSPCDSADAIGIAMRRGQVPVWMPSRMCLDRPEIPESWDVTSDSLALWLANQIGARQIVLIKAVTPPPDPVSSAALAELGLIDAAFGRFLSRGSAYASCLGPGQQKALADVIAGHGDRACRILNDTVP